MFPITQAIAEWLTPSFGAGFLANAGFGGQVLSSIGKHGSGRKEGKESTPISTPFVSGWGVPGKFYPASNVRIRIGKPRVETIPDTTEVERKFDRTGRTSLPSKTTTHYIYRRCHVPLYTYIFTCLITFTHRRILMPAYLVITLLMPLSARG